MWAVVVPTRASSLPLDLNKTTDGEKREFPTGCKRMLRVTSYLMSVRTLRADYVVSPLVLVPWRRKARADSQKMLLGTAPVGREQ